MSPLIVHSFGHSAELSKRKFLVMQKRALIDMENQRLTNRQNRWISSVGPPRLPHNHNNQFWHRVANKFQNIHMFEEETFEEVFGFTRQQCYQLRDTFIYPMLQQAGIKLPHSLTPDSLTSMFLL